MQVSSAPQTEQDQIVSQHQIVINEALETFLQQQFPVGSCWMHPVLDTGYRVLAHQRKDGTPWWYWNGPVRFEYPVAVLEELPKGISKRHDLGFLSQLIRTDGDADLGWFERNKRENPDCSDHTRQLPCDACEQVPSRHSKSQKGN